MQTSFIVHRQDYKQCKFVESNLPTADSMAEGEVLLKIDKFSFTSNNVTYAHAQKRNQEWGAEAFQAKVAKAWRQFIENTNQWLEVNHASTKEEIVAGYLELLAGKINPKSGLMMIYKNIL